MYNIKIYCLHYGDCDPKKCTALKLKKLKKIKIIPNITGKLKKALVLNPFSSKEIDVQDREIILKYGLIVIDCSWNKILNKKIPTTQNPRRLPPLIAANPINYGKWEKLNSAEAIISSLYLTGFRTKAEDIASQFRWGHEFLRINKFKKKK
ncbi:MAG: DUF367 family protein [Promethearchaeia archaeon]